MVLLLNSKENLQPRLNPCHYTVFIPGISQWRIFPRKFSRKSLISADIFTGFSWESFLEISADSWEFPQNCYLGNIWRRNRFSVYLNLIFGIIHIIHIVRNLKDTFKEYSVKNGISVRPHLQNNKRIIGTVDLNFFKK